MKVTERSKSSGVGGKITQCLRETLLGDAPERETLTWKVVILRSSGRSK